MKVSQIKELLAEYSDDIELMISINSKDDLEVESDDLWTNAVKIYEDWDLTGFNNDCEWAISEAERASK